MQLLVINPGATSTKISIFQDKKEIFKKNIEHSVSDLVPFEKVIDQLSYRNGMIRQVLKDAGFKPSDFGAVCARGGLLRHISSGTYEVNAKVLDDIYHQRFGEHASNLGALIAKELADEAGVKAYFVDPPSVDEMTEIAHFTGFSEMRRECFFHALNQKAMARKAAKKIGKKYEELNIIGVHIGGGVSVVAHEKGRVVDAFNSMGEGAFSMNRAGGLPANDLIEFCFSGKTKSEIKKILYSLSGVFSYLGTFDFREVETKIDNNDSYAKLVVDALIYQLCKDIGAMAAVLKFEVDTIILTGGMANSKLLCNGIRSYVEKLAPITILPGEEEMQALAEGTFRVLNGEAAMVY